jgi:hypothetical protein
MCFSPTASFSAGAVLLGLGTLTLKSARRPRELLFAAIPLLFAIQQLSEGVIWLTFSNEAVRLNTVMTYVYSFFSHVLWPAYVPVAVFLIEPPGRRRRTLFAFVAAGVTVGAYLLYILVAYPIASRPTGQHIEYVSPHFFKAAVMTLYLLSTTVSPILSTHQMVKAFGVLALLSFGAVYYFYATWFISVWCFFAALLSLVVYLHFLRHRIQRSRSAENTLSAHHSYEASMLTHRHESNGFVPSSVDRVFAHIDDHTRLSSHMGESSWKMGGGRMETELDEGRGQKIGSRIRLAGQVFGVELAVEEIVTERNPPHRKVWETTGAPKLLVIGHYRMGFELSPQGNGSMLRVFIEYALPEKAPARWLGCLFSQYYARWCTQQMVDDAVKHFASCTQVSA